MSAGRVAFYLLTDGDPVPLEDCPVGLFLASGQVCLRTEYSNGPMARIDAYIESSGEAFWGSSPQTVESQRAEMVQPLIVVGAI